MDLIGVSGGFKSKQLRNDQGPVTGVNPVAGSFLFRAGNGGNRGKPAGTKLDGTRDHPQHQEQEGIICAPGGMAIARKRNDQGATRLQQSWTE